MRTHPSPIRRFRRLAVVAAVAATVAVAASGCTAPANPTGIPGSWHNVFTDDFNGPSLDHSKWAPDWFGNGNVQNNTTMLDQNVSVSNGNLVLKLNGSGGLISSDGKFSFSYGAIEARIFLPASGGQMANWPAFWTDGQNWPADGENDVMEGLGGPACYHFHSNSGGPGGCASGNYSGWHVFGADWEPGSVTYYYDGRVVGRVTSGITSAPQFIIAENSAGGPRVEPSTMLIDYIKVWQH